MPRISRRRDAGSPPATVAGRLAGTRLLASDAALGAAEEIANPGDRLDHIARFAVRAELPSKTAHVQLHEISAHVRVVAPHALEDLLLGEDAAGVRHEVTQELELRRREVHRNSVRAHLVSGLVEDEVAGLVDGRSEERRVGKECRW